MKRERIAVILTLIAIALNIFVMFVYPELYGNKFRIFLLFVMIATLIINIVKIKKQKNKQSDIEHKER